MASRFRLFACGVLLCGMASTAIAQIANPCGPSGSGQSGHGLFPITDGTIVYDANQGVCWLANANLAGNSAMRTLFGVSGINPNGTMDFATAQNWVAALNAYNNGAGYLAHNNWQLPVAPTVDSTCAATGTGGGSFGPLCAGSAMGNLYYVGLKLAYPGTVAPGFGSTVAPFRNIKLSYYWAQQNDGTTSQQEVMAFSNATKGGVTIKYPDYYALPMVPGPLAGAPSCSPGSGVLPYLSGAAAGNAVYDCVTGYTWSADANLAAANNFGITGNTVVVADNGTLITAPLINDGKMLFNTADQWIAAMNNNGYLGSSAWQLPATSVDLLNLAAEMNLASGDARLMTTGSQGSFQSLQPFYYWGCGRDQTGNSQSPCTGLAPGGLQWDFNFDDGFQGTALTNQKFFVMVYYPAPVSVGVVPQSGWWWDPKLNGTGFFIEQGGKSGTGMFVGGFLYDAAGNDTWLVSTGPLHGSTYINTWLKATGGQTLLGAYKAPTLTNVGNMTIAFSDSTHAVMTRPDGTQVNLQRFGFTASPTPAPPETGAPQSGWWWAGTSLSGTGYGVEIQGSSVFIVAYVYDSSGNPVWYLATGALTSTTSYLGTWQLYAGGPQLTSPEGTYSAHPVTGSSVPMTLTFSDATHGTLTMGNVMIPIVRFQEF